MSDVSVFFANDGVDGIQLWRTDGTAAGTFALTAFPLSFSTAGPSPITLVDGVEYFTIGSGAVLQLWRSDGTVAGTFEVGASGDSPSFEAPKVVQAGANVFYVGVDSSHGLGLFDSIGTQPGQFVAPITSSDPSAPGFEFLGAVGSDLLFNVGGVVWVSDGTGAGTHALSDGEANAGLRFASGPVTVGGQGYLVATDSTNNSQLWRINGASTATAVGSAITGTNLGSLKAVGNDLIFTAAGTPSAQTLLQSWDGVAPSSSTIFAGFSAGPFLPPQDGKLFFQTSHGSIGADLFVTDGSVAGTHEVTPGGFTVAIEDGANFVLAGFIPRAR